MIIPSYLFEELDDSLDLEWIPSFFFKEQEESVNLDPQEEKPIPNSSNSICIKGSLTAVFFSNRISFFNNHNQQTLWGSWENHELFRELMLSHNKLSGTICFPLLLDYSRLLFDRGKGFLLMGKHPCWVRSCSKFCIDLLTSGFVIFNGSIILLVLCNKKIASKMVSIHGYESNSLFNDSFVLVFVKTDNIGDGSTLFVKMTQRNKFLFLLLARIVAFIRLMSCLIKCLITRGEQNFICR